MKKQIGLISLSFTIIGLVLIQIGIHLHLLQSNLWIIVLAGFEAGTVGGLADWFAVSALFREIPIPIVSKHTNIIVKNRQKLTEAVVDLVTNKWLTHNIILQKIAAIPIAKNVFTLLQVPTNKVKAIEFLKFFLRKITDNLDNPEVAAFLQSILKDQIQGIDIATPFGKWLEKAIKRGDHKEVWEMVLNAAQKTINNYDTQKALLLMVQKKAEEYKGEGFFKRIFLNLAEGVGALDKQAVVEKIVSAINEFIDDAKNNPFNNVRQRFDQFILEFAVKLANGDEEAQSLVNGIKNQLVDNTDALKIIQDMLTRFKSTISNQLDYNETPFMQLLIKNIDQLLDNFSTNPITLERIDNWIKETLSQLIGKYHHEIGGMIRESLIKLDDKELVAQIEEKVGNDLQYIRLNGAIVGGLVGMLIEGVKMLIR